MLVTRRSPDCSHPTICRNTIDPSFEVVQTALVLIVRLYFKLKEFQHQAKRDELTKIAHQPGVPRGIIGGSSDVEPFVMSMEDDAPCVAGAQRRVSEGTSFGMVAARCFEAVGDLVTGMVPPMATDVVNSFQDESAEMMNLPDAVDFGSTPGVPKDRRKTEES